MTTKFTRAVFATTSSSLAMGVALAMFGAAPALAQDAASPAPQTEEEKAAAEATAAEAAKAAGGGEEIVVTGFRASLSSAVGTKKRQDQIVESVSAEEIGKLPDSSIAESIARLPGLTTQRLNGRANVIAIRGFGPDFSTTLLNGREQTSTNDNRGVEFDQYPSEIISQVVVYKTPSASLVGQGLVGTVDLRTVRPLEYGKQVIAVGARGTLADIGALNAQSKDKGFRVNATYVDQFANDTIGIALAAAYLDEPYQNEEFNAWGYGGGGTQANPFVIGGSKSYVTSTQLKRYGINGTLQFKPTDTLTITADGLYSHFDDEQFKRGIELPLGFGAFGTGFNPATATVTDGFATSGTFTNVRGVVRNDIFERKANLYSGGLNLAYKGDTGWNAYVDVSYSKTKRSEFLLQGYSGTGYNGDDTGNGASATIGFESTPHGTVFSPSIDYSDPTRIFLTDPLGWGGSIVQAGYYNDRRVNDKINQYRGELEREFGGPISAVKIGLNYTQHTKSLNPVEFFITLPNGQTQVALPSQYQLKPTSLDYLGLGPILSYDVRELLADGILILQANTDFNVRRKAYSVDENVLTGYVQADLKADLGASELTGNAGIQFVRTDQSSSGVAFSGGQAIPVKSGLDYMQVLPSLNLSLRTPGDMVFRFAVARELQRPRLDDLRVAIDYGIDNSGPVPIISGGGGNPQLKPYGATALDFNVEKYFGNNGYVALQLYYKSIDRYISNGVTQNFDYSGFPPPSGPPVPSPIGRLFAPVNTDGGYMYGWELAATLPFNVLTRSLDGFGFTGGVGYTKTRVKNFNGDPDVIPGYSKWVANGTLFFEKWGFNARGSMRYRSSFLGDFVSFDGGLSRRTALEETVIDGQIGYDFQKGSTLEGLSLYLQGQNLTDERFATISNNDPRLVTDYQIYGRRFLAGFTYKF